MGLMEKLTMRIFSKIAKNQAQMFRKPKAIIEYLLNIAVRIPIDIDSEVGWITSH